MKRMSKFFLVAAASAAMTNVALADDPAPDATAPTPPPDGTAPAPTVKADVAAGGAFTAATWPKEYVARPQSAAKGMVEVTPTFGIYRVTSDDGMGNTASKTSTSRTSALVPGGGTPCSKGSQSAPLQRYSGTGESGDVCLVMPRTSSGPAPRSTRRTSVGWSR